MIDVTKAASMSTEAQSVAKDAAPIVEPTSDPVAVNEPRGEGETADRDATADDAREKAPTPTVAKKFGFGAGMRMYAKSLAQAEEAEKVVPVEEKEDTTDVVDVAVDDVESKAEQRDVEAPQCDMDAPETQSSESGVAAPKDSETVAKDTPASEPVKGEDLTAETEVVELLSEDDITSESKAAVLTTACGSLYQQLLDSVLFFLRKAEDGLDDAHEKVCARNVSCATDLDNEILEKDEPEDSTVEETADDETPTAEADAQGE